MLDLWVYIKHSDWYNPEINLHIIRGHSGTFKHLLEILLATNGILFNSCLKINWRVLYFLIKESDVLF